MTANNSTFIRTTAKNSINSSLGAAIASHLNGLGVNVLVQVVAVHPGNGFTGTVDVRPLVHQQASDGTTIPHGIMYTIPYLRIQGGTCAIIIDPEPGDLGFAVIAGRDQTQAVANRAPSPPGSFRTHSMADAVYIGGYLNDDPINFIKITSQGITITTQNEVNLNASSVNVVCDLNVQGKITATKDIIGNDISLSNHVHGGVQSGNSKTGEPE